MKTPIEFDYDLWTTEEGKCMVRVKLTGEVCEVSRETMRVLRNEEKKLRRSKTGVPIAGCEDEDETATLLSLDFVSVQDAEEMPDMKLKPANTSPSEPKVRNVSLVLRPSGRITPRNGSRNAFRDTIPASVRCRLPAKVSLLSLIFRTASRLRKARDMNTG